MRWLNWRWGAAFRTFDWQKVIIPKFIDRNQLFLVTPLQAQM